MGANSIASGGVSVEDAEVGIDCGVEPGISGEFRTAAKLTSRIKNPNAMCYL